MSLLAKWLFKGETLEQKLIRIVGTSDPEEIRRMLDETKRRQQWRPPTITREPTAKQLAARLGK